MQEKFGFTFDEATFYCCEMFRKGDKIEFFENVFGMNYDEYIRWCKYMTRVVSEEELSTYIGAIKPNRLEADVYQWF